MDVNGWLVLDEDGAIGVDHRRPRRLDLNKLERREDGAVIFNARPARTGDYQYMAYEIPRSITGAESFDEIVTGHIEASEMEKVLPQMEGLVVTNDHRTTNSRNRSDAEIGRVMRPGVLGGDGFVTTRIVITNSDAVTDVERGKRELSIGFRGTPVKNEDRKSEGDPHFHWTNIKLNHLAVVDAARAGPDAVVTHSAFLKDSGPSMVPVAMAHSAPKQKTKETTMKISLGGREVEMDDADARALEAERAAHNNTVAERDTKIGELQGQNAAHAKTIADLRAEAEGSGEKIQHAVAAHSKLADSMKMIGEEFSHSAGAYDPTAIKAEVLAKHSIDVSDPKNSAVVDAAFNGYVKALEKNPGTVEHSVAGAHAGHPSSRDGKFVSTLAD